MLPVILGLGGLAFFFALKSGAKADPDAESHAIGLELASLPNEAQAYVGRLLMTNDPALTRTMYTSAILQMQQAGKVAIAKRLIEMVQQRDGAQQ